MKTNIFEIDGRYFVKTGKVIVYELVRFISDNDGDVVDYDYLYEDFDEIVDVCTGEKYAYDGIMYYGINEMVIGNPVDSYNERRVPNKRGRHSCSHNKQATRLARKVLHEEDIPF